MERDVGEGNLATAAASALAAAAVKAKVKLIITEPQMVSFIIYFLFFFFYIFPNFSFSTTLFTAPGCSGREEDQISGGSAGGNPNEEAGN